MSDPTAAALLLEIEVDAWSVFKRLEIASHKAEASDLVERLAELAADARSVLFAISAERNMLQLKASFAAARLEDEAPDGRPCVLPKEAEL